MLKNSLKVILDLLRENRALQPWAQEIILQTRKRRSTVSHTMRSPKMGERLRMRVIRLSSGDGAVPLPPTQRFILFVLADEVDDESPWPSCCLSITQIMGMTSASRKTVKRTLRALREKGLLVTRERPGLVNVHWVRLPAEGGAR
jgi:hypothetical protein